MIKLICERRDVSAEESFMVSGLAVGLRVTQLVNVNVNVNKVILALLVIVIIAVRVPRTPCQTGDLL